MMHHYSLLDLSPIVEEQTAADALNNTLDLARHADGLGYHRYWLAEHHNMPGIASAATSVVMCHIAGGTRHIRVGAGGIMLSREQSNARLLTRIDEDQARLDTRMEDLEVRTTTQFTVMNRIMDEMKNLQSYLDSQMENLPFTKKND